MYLQLLLTMRWPNEKILELISAYQSEELFWNPKCRDFKNKGKAREVWKKISKNLNVDQDECEKKMRCLIGQFQRELKKVTSITAEGTLIDMNKSYWYPFKHLLFLKDYKSTVKSQQEDEIDGMISPSGLIKNANIRKTNKLSLTDEIDETSQETVMTSFDEQDNEQDNEETQNQTYLEAGEIDPDTLNTVSSTTKQKVLYVFDLENVAPVHNKTETKNQIEVEEIDTASSVSSSSSTEPPPQRSNVHRKIENRENKSSNKTKSSLVDKFGKDNYAHESQSSVSSTSSPEPPRKRIHLGKSSIRKKSLSIDKLSKDEYDLFGEYVSRKVRKLSTKYAKITAQYKITNILYDAEMGKFDYPTPKELPKGRDPVKIFLPSRRYSAGSESDS